MREGWGIKTFDEIISSSLIGIVRNNKEQSVEFAYRYFKMNNIRNDNGINEGSFSFVNATDEEVKKYSLEQNDFLFNTRNSFELVGKTCLYKSKDKEVTLFNNNILRVRFKNYLIPQFVAYAFSTSTILERLEKMKSGTTSVVGIYYKSLKNLPLPIPPLQEQQQIVAILDQAFEAIDQAKANIEKNIINAKELFQSKLNDIFSQKGDGWEEKSLNTICEVKDGTHDSPKYIDKELGIPFVTQKNILDDGISFENTKFISLENHNDFYKRSNVAYNDILFSMIGANRGMACVVDDKRVFSIKNVGLIKSNENYRPKFLLYFFKSSIAQKFIAENSSGSAQGFVSLGKLRTFPIPFTHIENQKKIESIVESLNDSVNSTISNYKQKLNNLEDLKKSILQKAFAGELTSPERTK
ncbi:restriction endonuclease subunit S [Flavobacterium sp. 7A]|uniref:restriction endonuclease subunit S n=1 Tax=Flavobacterium sp. 7A TaxID=2940571 RepID=UPI0022263EB0|nr:restriction endonuclease subunit S [Flavobacterium sp. 7A]MCW2119697.1 type I restriction enzyme S subunit [Flavobacterium sp. 7A]